MKIKVSTVAFSKNSLLVTELKRNFPDAEVNVKGVRIPENELADFYGEADGIIVGLEKITPELLDRLPKLKIIAKYGVGLDNIDIDACKERNIAIGWIGGINKRSVAEMTLGFMLALCRNLYTTSNQLKKGEWNKNGGMQLSGKTIGIIGAGNIGQEVINLLKPFQCKLLVNDIIDLPRTENILFTQTTKELIYREADIISIHTPLTSETNNFINKSVFEQMKKTAFLINTARGEIVNQNDLKTALKEEIISGAAIDVYENEPPEDLAFLNLPNLICTPHTGGNAVEAVIAMGISAIEELVKFRNN